MTAGRSESFKQNTAGGIILAAGLSSRMRRYKAMLPIGDTTFIRKIILHMRDAGIGDIVVVTGYRHTQLERHLSGMGVICVYNERFYESEMIDSLKLGLQALPEHCEAAFITPVDVALVPADVYRRLLPAEGAFIRPVYDGRHGHPVVRHRRLFGSVFSYAGDGGLRGAIAASGGKVVDVELDDDSVVMDADTPEDYMRMLRQYDESLGEKGRLHAQADVRLYSGELLFNDEVILLIELIDKTGSLRKAAGVMHISYTKAWKMLKHVEQKVTYPLMRRQAGGEEGGCSYLTDEGKELLQRYRAMKRELDQTADVIFEKHFRDFRV